MKLVKLILSYLLILLTTCSCVPTTNVDTGNPDDVVQPACDIEMLDDTHCDIKEAIAAYEKAAKLGNMTVQGILSNIYASGEGGLDVQFEKAVSLARSAVATDCPFGHYTLANAYRFGKGVPADADTAHSHALAAMKRLPEFAENGNARAQQILGVFYATGRGGVERDDAQAVAWYRKSAQQNLARAQYNLGMMFEDARGGLECDVDQARANYGLAAKQGYPAAKYALAELSVSPKHNTQQEIDAQAAEAVSLYESAAEQNYVNALLALLVIHRDGTLGVPEDEAKAVSYLRRAAEQGDAHSQATYGSILATGSNGVTQDLDRAVEMSQLAAAQGNPIGYFNLGQAYREGLGGLEANDVEAVRLFELGAQQNHAPSLFELGTMRWFGYGIEKDITLAVELLKQAAEIGHGRAALMLGFLYEYGEGGLTKSMTSAAKFYEKAAELDEPEAKFFFAYQLFTGEGIEEDIPRAMSLLREASQQGLESATTLLLRFEQLEKLQERVAIANLVYPNVDTDEEPFDWDTYWEVQARYDRSRDRGLNYNRR